MNDELKTKEYFKSMEHIKLSDSSRERIKTDLLAHARFHAVTEVTTNAKPTQSPFLSWLRKPAPAFLVVMLLVGTTTSLLAKDAAPGEFLYALKTGVNENFRGVFALGTRNEVDAPSETTAEQVAQAPEQQADETAPAETKTTLTKNDSPRSDTPRDTTLAINARAKVPLEESVADVASDLTTMLSQGTWSIADHTADLKLREKTLRDLVKKHDAELDTKVKTNFKAKLDSAHVLTVDAEGKSEVDARATLDKATVLIGEIEAELSTLGEVKVENGVIVDIDLTLDKTKDDVKTSVDETLDAVDEGLEAVSGLGL